MNTIDHLQGTDEWLAARARHFTASEAPAMMGASKYTTRSELLRQKATGIVSEVDSHKQRLFDSGHAAEAAARPLVEAIIGDGLFPVTGSLEVDGLPLLASFDGLTMMEDIAWETKLWNAALADALRAGQIEPHYYWQLEQQLLVSGAAKVYFTTTDGTAGLLIGMWYESVPERRAALIAGWKQFAEDLSNYQHVEAKPEPTAATIEALPALFVQVEGKVLATNLDAFKASARTFIDNIKTELVNDQDFADADKMVKFLKDGEERLALAKSQALSQTASIDELFRTVDAISEQMRSKRLALDKLVKAEKENRRTEIVATAQNALHEHYKALNARIGGNWMPPLNAVQFAEAVKGLKSLDSMRDKVSGTLANAKIEANEIADRIEANRKSLLIGSENDTGHLFPDFAQVCTKAREDFAALHAMRIQQEAVRKEAEREKIRKEEADKLAKQAEEDQRGKTEDATHAVQQATEPPQAPAASTPPIQQSDMGQSLNGLAGKTVRAADHIAGAGKEIDAALITEFIRLLSISPTEKKALRTHLLAWEKYRIARGMQEAA